MTGRRTTFCQNGSCPSHVEAVLRLPLLLELRVAGFLPAFTDGRNAQRRPANYRTGGRAVPVNFPCPRELLASDGVELFLEPPSGRLVASFVGSLPCFQRPVVREPRVPHALKSNPPVGASVDPDFVGEDHGLSTPSCFTSNRTVSRTSSREIREADSQQGLYIFELLRVCQVKFCISIKIPRKNLRC